MLCLALGVRLSLFSFTTCMLDSLFLGSTLNRYEDVLFFVDMADYFCCGKSILSMTIFGILYLPAFSFIIPSKSKPAGQFLVVAAVLDTI